MHRVLLGKLLQVLDFKAGSQVVAQKQVIQTPMALHTSKIMEQPLQRCTTITLARARAVIAPIKRECSQAVLPTQSMVCKRMEARACRINCSNYGSTRLLKIMEQHNNSDSPQLPRLNKLKFKILMPAEQYFTAKLSCLGLALSSLSYTTGLSSPK